MTKFKTTMTPRSSLIIPTHNRAHLLPRAINSVLAQTDGNWELIVVDDGSTDDTKAVVSKYSDARIRYVYQTNRQLNGARNTGVRHADGQYAGFLDDDDELLPDHLARLHQAITETNGKFDIYRSGEILRRSAKDTPGVNYNNGEDILPQFWKHPTGMFGMLINTDLLSEHTFDEAHLLLDDFLWLNKVLPHATVHQVDAHSAVVNLHDDQRSAHYLNDELLHKNVSRLAEAYNLPEVSTRVPFSAYQQQVFHQYVHYSRQLGRKGKTIKALRMWRKGLSYATTKDAREMARTMYAAIFRS